MPTKEEWELREVLSQFCRLCHTPRRWCAFFLFGQARGGNKWVTIMIQETSFLTAEGYERLQAELEHLETVRRREVAAKIQSAKEDGDISENAGYEQAKEEQAFLEGRIMTLQGILRAVTIIEEKGPTDRVGLGCRVTVVEVEGERHSLPETYRIVGSVEADPFSGCISNESPLGQALLGRGVGENVAVSAPGGEIRFEIVSIA